MLTHWKRWMRLKTKRPRIRVIAIAVAIVLIAGSDASISKAIVLCGLLWLLVQSAIAWRSKTTWGQRDGAS